MSRIVLPRLFAIVVLLLAGHGAMAQGQVQKIGLHTSLSGSVGFGGRALVEAMRVAIDEANASASGPRFELVVFDDQSTEAGARAAAAAAVASDAMVVIGPASSGLGILAGPIYSAGSLVLIDATVHADAITDAPTVFRTVVSTGEIGEAQANYLGHVMLASEATVFYIDSGYGRPLNARFRETAEQLGIKVRSIAFANATQRDEAARRLAEDNRQSPLILGMTYEDVVSVLKILKRGNYGGPIIGTATMARSSFVDLFRDEPEEARARGYFSDGVYAVSPMIIDSANADTLAFAQRYRTSVGQEPSWETVQAYDSGRLAVAALRAVLSRSDIATADLKTRREAVRQWLLKINGPAVAQPGLTGGIWFTPGRIRPQTVRMGHFFRGLYESAPLQIVDAPHPNAADIASGAVFELRSGQYGRLQRVVSAGVFVNEITQIDLSRQSFGADFYVWLRYARDAGPNAADPDDITFQNMIGGKFDKERPSEQGEMADGTIYRLWRVQGEFRNDFDLHRYPFDRQRLTLPFFNARAATDRVVYVLDRRGEQRQRVPRPASGGPIAAQAAAPGVAAMVAPAITSTQAFRNLTQWSASDAAERRENLVTASALGDPRRVGIERSRELSGFVVTIDVQRRVLATLTKALLPLVLMTVIMFASLYFPHGLVKEKVTVAITAALSGAVLLAAINGQLGGIGYTIAVEYAFYVFFGLSLLCVVAVLTTERMRVAKHIEASHKVEHWTRMLFLLAVAVTVAAGVGLYTNPR